MYNFVLLWSILEILFLFLFSPPALMLQKNSRNPIYQKVLALDSVHNCVWLTLYSSANFYCLPPDASNCVTNHRLDCCVMHRYDITGYNESSISIHSFHSSYMYTDPRPKLIIDITITLNNNNNSINNKICILACVWFFFSTGQSLSSYFLMLKT